MKKLLTFIVLILLAACSAPSTGPPPTPGAEVVPTAIQQANMPNPASVYCQEQGYTSEIRTSDDGSQNGVCIFSDGGECDEWAYYRGECSSAAQEAKTPAPTGTPTALPAPPPAEPPTATAIDPALYAGWQRYTHPVYGFAIMLPEDWVVEEPAADDPLLGGHLLMLHPATGGSPESIRMTFRRVGEETLLWPTGVGQGEFIPQGTLDVAGQPAQRVLLFCPGGDVTSIWYQQGEGQPNITRGDLEFGVIYSAGPHCESGLSLGGKTQLVGEMIIASLRVP